MKDSINVLQETVYSYCVLFCCKDVYSDTLTNYLTDFNEQNKSLIIDIYWKSL